MSIFPSSFAVCRLLACLVFTAGLLSAQEAPPGTSAVPAATPSPSPVPPYRLAATWEVPGEGGWGELAVDTGARRLYVARQDRVQVLDADKGDLVGELTGLDDPRGLAISPRSGRGCVVNGKTSTLVFFDLKTLERAGEPIPVGAEPDAVVYVPWREKALVFNQGSRDATVVDTKEDKTTGTIPLGGKPVSALVEGGGRIFVALEDKNEVLAIDLETLAIENRYSLKTGKRPEGMSLDPDGGRLFIGCGNERLVVMATEDGTIMGVVSTGKGAADTAFDTRTKLAFALNSADGTMTVADAYRASTKSVGTLPTGLDARTLTVDQRTHAVYVVAAAPGSNAAPGQTPPGSLPRCAVLKYDYEGTRK